MTWTDSGAFPGCQRRLRIEQIVPEADRVVSVFLIDPKGEPLPPWSPGSHVDILLPSGRIRQYSLCGDLHDDGSYRLGILLDRYEQGASKELHDGHLLGTTVTIRGPRNDFPIVAADNYLFLAGGIGITPILSMLQWVEEQRRPWTLLYGARSRAAMPYLAEIDARKGGTITLVAEDEFGYPDFAGAIAAAPEGTHVYGCGPSAMLETLEDLADGLSFPNRVHLERFTPFRYEVAAMLQSGIPFEVELRQSRRVLQVPENRSLLSVLSEVVNIPYSCKLGNCGLCEVRVLEGEPDHRDVVLSEATRASNKRMIACVSRSMSDRLVLDL